jgi:predicted nucleotidyltransferase
MELYELQLPNNHQGVVDRFVAACQADERVVAAFLGGSYAKGTADVYSDLDLYLIILDEAFQDFLAERKAFIRLLGEPLFLEDFGTPHLLFYMFADRTEGELWVHRESLLDRLHTGPYRVLLDKKGILANAVFPQREADQAKQVETLRQQVAWFWHDLSHFVKAMGRGQLWFAYGELEVLRQMCVNLARLRYNFADAWVGEEPYFKVEQVLPVERLSPLQTTFCAMEYGAMLQAALVMFRFYRDVASELAKEHSIEYQADLERMMISQLEELGATGLDFAPAQVHS